MGIPSISIYAHELICDYNVQTLVRIGTCGAFPNEMKPCNVFIAQGACTVSACNKHKFRGMDCAPVADFDLLRKAYDYAKHAGLKARLGNVLTSDAFYNNDEPNPYDI